jgi:hypothetical protein
MGKYIYFGSYAPISPDSPDSPDEDFEDDEEATEEDEYPFGRYDEEEEEESEERSREIHERVSQELDDALNEISVRWTRVENVCVCGAASIGYQGGKAHSSWCPRHSKV